MLDVKAYCRHPNGQLMMWSTGFTNFTYEAQIERLINDVTMEVEKELGLRPASYRAYNPRSKTQVVYKPIVLLLIQLAPEVTPNEAA